MAVNELVTRLTNDATQFNQSMDESTDKVKNLQDKVKDTTKTVNDLGKRGAISTRELLSEIGKFTGAEKSVSNYRRQLAQMTRDISDLTINYKSMTKEMQNSDIGRATLDKINELTVKAGQYKDAINDSQQAITRLASDTAAWDGIKQGINAASGALQGFVSLGVLGEKSTEGLVKVIAKLKGVEAATNSVIQIGNALQKQSALMMGISTIQAKALAKAKELETLATGKATIAQRLFNTVAKANPYVLLASAIIAAGAALLTFTKLMKKSVDETNYAKQAQDAYNEALNKAQNDVATTVAKFTVLERQYKSLKSEADKVKWINDNSDAFKELGYKIDDVNTADDVFINHAKDVIRAMELRAQAAAILSVYQEKYAEAYKKSLEVEQKKNNQKGGQWTKKDWDAAGLKAGEDYVNNPITMNSSAGATTFNNYQLTESGRKKMEEYGKQCGEAVREGAKESMQGMLDDMIDLQAEADKLDAKWRIKEEPKPTGGSGGKGGKVDTPYKNQLDILRKQKSELEDQKKYLEYGSEEWKKQLQLIEEIERKIKNLEQGEQGYIARLRNAALGPISPISSPITTRVEGPKETIKGPVTNDQKVSIYQDAQKAAAKYREYFELGLISGDTAQTFIDALNQSLENQGIKATVGLNLDVDDQDVESALSQIQQKMDQIGNLISAPINAIKSVGDAFKEMSETFEDPDASAWEEFFSVFHVGETILSAVSTVLGVVNAVTELLTASKNKNAQATAKETAAEVAQIPIKAQNTAANVTEAATAGVAAGAKGASSVASVPYVGPILAIAALASIMAAIIGAIATAKGFATGGVVGGHSYTGDKILARLNSGELVLNQKQQNQLLNENTVAQTGAYINIPDKITLTAHGKDLQATLVNVNKYNSKI